MTDLTAASLFAGVGGFDLALERSGVNVVAAAEIDPHARAVLGRRFPDTRLFDDVTKVSGDDLRAAGFIPDRGIITAGFPCQDLSVAGRRAGLAGTRSGLWWHVVRLLDETCARWLIAENVPGLLSSNDGNDFGAVLGSLADLGYGFAYRILDAQFFGVPQRRQRVFIVGHFGAPFGAAAEVLLEPESSAGDSAQGSTARSTTASNLGESLGNAGGIAPALTARYGKGTDGKGTDGKGTDALILDSLNTHTHTQFRHCRVAGNADIGSTPNQQRAGTSSSRKVVAALTSNGVGTCGPDDNQAQAGHFVVQPLAVRGREGGADVEIGPENGPYNCLRAGDGGSSRNQLVSIAFSHTAGIDCQPSENVSPTIKAGHDTMPAVAIDMRNAARASGTGAGTQGDGITVGGPSYTLSGTQMGLPAVGQDTVVRRLTELECERLQGFPDDWTDGQSGGARYRQLGNAVAVPVVEWIVKRLIEVDGELS